MNSSLFIFSVLLHPFALPSFFLNGGGGHQPTMEKKSKTGKNCVFFGTSASSHFDGCESYSLKEQLSFFCRSDIFSCWKSLCNTRLLHVAIFRASDWSFISRSKFYRASLPSLEAQRSWSSSPFSRRVRLPIPLLHLSNVWLPSLLVNRPLNTVNVFLPIGVF